MRVLMLAIRYDTDDWATHFIPRWATQLAAQVEALDVLALEVGALGDVPPNMRVFSMGKERGRGRADVLAGFYRHAMRLITRADVVFVHMIPRYALLVAPLAMATRTPMVLWYTHRNPSRDLRRAMPLLWRVVTAAPSSFPLASDKVRVLGHGIDPAYFAPDPHIMPHEPPQIVQVARLQAIKQQGALIDALAYLPDARALFVGAVPSGEDAHYPQALGARAEALGVAARVTFAGGLDADGVRDAYRRAAVAVNLSPPGLFDKAALESMATGTPTLVTNEAFAPLMGPFAAQLTLSHPPQPPALAERLAALIALTPSERGRMAETLRANVSAAHSLDRLVPRLVHVLRTGELP